ncbi:MAG: YraN family protein [Bacteroidales bacterium]|nr:YraN family protein [Bacteroidales bacterium]
MNLQPTSKLGSKGEQMACDFLETRGHQILDRNWHGGHLEIDIVSEAPDGVHFIEVKARTAPVLAPLDRQIPRLKQKRINAAALQYLHSHKLDGQEVYFDVVSVIFEGAQTMVKYYPQAWIPMFT